MGSILSGFSSSLVEEREESKSRRISAENLVLLLCAAMAHYTMIGTMIGTSIQQARLLTVVKLFIIWDTCATTPTLPVVEVFAVQWQALRRMTRALHDWLEIANWPPLDGHRWKVFPSLPIHNSNICHNMNAPLSLLCPYLYPYNVLSSYILSKVNTSYIFKC